MPQPCCATAQLMSGHVRTPYRGGPRTGAGRTRPTDCQLTSFTVGENGYRADPDGNLFGVMQAGTSVTA
jgi:hypothetical protein